MITALRGMKDLLPPTSILYEKVIKTCTKIAAKYGYESIHTPHLEATSLFRRSVGESSDIVGKEMYQFEDKGGNDVCLRPEGTAGVVRAFIEAKLDRAGGVHRWCYAGSMFRYERPQKGRLREFHQFGVECFGEGSVYEDANIITMAYEILKSLEIKTTLKLNSLGTASDMAEYKKRLISFLDANDAHICEDCKRRKQTNPIRVLDCKNESCQIIYANAPLITDSLGDEARTDFALLQDILRQNGVEYELDARLVRGLDYYCKTAFEFVSDEIGAQSAVTGGGRYDRLVEYLGGRASYGVGFAMGIERLMAIMALKQETSTMPNGVYVGSLDDEFIPLAFSLANRLRKSVKAVSCYEPRKLAKHLQAANNGGFKYALIIGEDEARSEQAWVKNLINGDERRIKFDTLVQEFCDE
ncbi:histidine--tRNA ligase [Campylobacter sp. 19-13652]|uniref:histidine--tRNA ligase n=1 Tax=Campylobacter sp. 19-13652 TaxID=2840180 RepID=UPI001C76BEB8|nr:histidine--tRNA ligase [Campylobacter sp. 19-13652]BCX79423.1 histidine--tRNA ligase [Campylobacter sp. 19-13652]